MIAIYFAYGLAFFCLGLAVALEARRASGLPLGHQLPWLAAFGLVHAMVEWSDMLMLANPTDFYHTVLLLTRTIFLPVSAIFLIRFGAGLIGEAGPLPRWLWFLPLILTAPAAFLMAYALVTASTDPYIAIDVWSRYLLYFTGCILTGIGFLRQRRALLLAGLSGVKNLMLAAALVFFFYAVMTGVIVPASPYGLSPWLNYELVFETTGVPVQFWRMLSAVAVTVFVIRALDVFEAERKQRLEKFEAQRKVAAATLRESEERFRTVFELAPIGMVLVRPDTYPFAVNRTFQDMMGYSASELCRQRFTDFTHPEDVESSIALVQDIAGGEYDHFRMQKRYTRKDGSVIWGNVAVSAVRNPDKELLYFIAMVEDITERKQMEEALRLERELVQATKLQAQSAARETAENWFNALVDISRRISKMESIDEILLDIAERTQKLLNADTVSIGLLEDSGSQLQLKYRAVGNRAFILNPPIVVESELLLKMLDSGRSYRLPEDVDDPEATWYCPTLADRIRAAAAVPLQFDGRLVGGIWVGRLAARSFTATDLVGLESISNQTVIALQHALMAARLQSLAVLEERSRIAREMHDSLAQILGYMGLQVQTLEALMRQGNYEKALAELALTRENIKVAQADVRENILSLRTTLADSTGVVSALEEYVTEFGLQTGKTTNLVLEFDGIPKLSPLAEVQMVRIVQEALANIRKHARAENVSVILAERDGCLSITISDDGIGFHSSTSRRQFGLQTMRERAELVGGGLMINSTPGKGTSLELHLPLLTE
ncbi:MAG: PAS domain S-box protein [Chloroflexota bacterium]|jgi:PAS domain S-box-containing protein